MESKEIEQIVNDAIIQNTDIPIINKFGRPEIYRPEMKAEVEVYLKKCIDEERQRVTASGSKGESYDYPIKVALPTLQGFAYHLGVSFTSVTQWKKKHPDFAAVCKEIEQKQFEALVNNSLGRQYDSKVALALLGANHGIRSNGDDPREALGKTGNLTINIVKFEQNTTVNQLKGEKTEPKEG